MNIGTQSKPFDLRGTFPNAAPSPFAQVLTSPFVGSDLSATPANSAFGTLIRLVRLNELAPGALHSMFGIRARRADDLSSVMTFSEARQIAMAQALGMADAPKAWNLSTWFPFRAPSNLLSDGWVLRYCPTCLHRGFHTLLHQLPWIGRCPWHQELLLDCCDACGRRASARADWAVGAILTCECGHNPVNTEETLYTLSPPPGAKEFIENYGIWAATRRAKTTLVLPDLAGDARSALHALVRMPPLLHPDAEWRGPYQRRVSGPGQSFGHSHSRTFRLAKQAPGPDRNALVQLEDLHKDRPGFLATPPRLAPRMAAVASRLALRLPPRTLTDREMSLFLAGTGIVAPKYFAPAARSFSSELTLLPPTQVGDQQYLNLTCIHPSAYRIVTKVLDVAMDGRTLFDFHAQASPSEFDLVMRSCGHLLARGYSEGLRSTLAVHIPELYGMARDVPRLTQPWILMNREISGVDSIRITWTRLNYSVMGEAALLVAEDDANSRRQRARQCATTRSRKAR